MKVSVIIPVYNAAPYVEKAVRSALDQEEVSEILLVEDSSTDGSLEICREMARAESRIRLLTHPGGENRGAAASRNLALGQVSNDFIAFLDADDYFLPRRFSKARAIFESNTDADGVYEAVGTHFYSNSAESDYRERFKSDLTTMDGGIAPERLFHHLVWCDKGWFCTDGIVFRRSLLEKTGFFDEDMELSEDNLLFMKLAYYGRLYPGELERPVAMRGVHSDNRSIRPDAVTYSHYRWQLGERALRWARGEKIELGDRLRLLATCAKHYRSRVARTERAFLRSPLYLFNLLEIGARRFTGAR